MRLSHVSPRSAARPPGAGPHCALNLDNLWLSDFCAPGYSPSQRRANLYKVQLNLVEKSMPLVLRKSLQGPVEPCREVDAVGAAQISTRSSGTLERSPLFSPFRFDDWEPSPSGVL